MNCANHSDREKIAFCQNCGKPLCQECTRTVGPAVYCEPCLAIKIGVAGAVPPAGAYSYSDPASGINASGTAASGGSYTYKDPVSGVYATGVIPPQPPHGAPSPILAGILGFIPGVGAMYNEQYAKAGVHLIVFVILVSIADSNGTFGILVAGWEFYMAFEAYRTAIARRDGLPLPNPFGLNDLGHKLGFDKSWHSPAPTSSAIPPDPYAAGYTTPPAGVAPNYAQAYPPPYTAPYTAPNAPPFNAGAVPPQTWGVPPTPQWEQYAPPMPPPVPLDAQVPYPGNRFPAGALWLIGLGALFLATNAGIFHGFSGRLFLPFLMIGFAVFIFVRKLTSYGFGLSSDGTPDYRVRVFRALKGSVWIALVGLLFFLNDFNILSWEHSWPLFIILAGVMTVLQRAVYSGAAVAAPPYAPGYGYAPQPAPPVTYAAAAPASTEFVPTSTHEGFTSDKEGS